MDPIRVPRIENRVSRIREIGSLQVHTGVQVVHPVHSVQTVQAVHRRQAVHEV